MQKINMRFSFDGLDLPAMQRSVEAITEAIELMVGEAVVSGQIDKSLLRSYLCALSHASSRAQEEYDMVRDESLPMLWTTVAHS